MDCMREDISVSKRNLAECEARVSSFDWLERGSETGEARRALNLSKFAFGLNFNPDDDDFDVGDLRVLVNTSRQVQRHMKNIFRR